MIVPVKVQLKGDKEPQRHLALVFEDAVIPHDFIPYRNALTTAAKEILTCGDYDGCCNDEMFRMLQLAEFISSSLEDELQRREPVLSAYQRCIAEANDEIFQQVLTNTNENNNEQQ